MTRPEFKVEISVTLPNGRVYHGQQLMDPHLADQCLDLLPNIIDTLVRDIATKLLEESS